MAFTGRGGSIPPPGTMEFRTLTASRSKTPIGPDILARAPRLSTIGAFCIGTEQVDLSACGVKEVAVFHTPYSNTRSVVEMALGEMILLLRGVFESSNRLHRGVRMKSSEGFHEIRAKRVSIRNSRRSPKRSVHASSTDRERSEPW